MNNKKYLVKVCYISKNARQNGEILINGKSYRKGVTRTESVTEDILKVMEKGKKEGWFSVEVLKAPESVDVKTIETVVKDTIERPMELADDCDFDPSFLEPVDASQTFIASDDIPTEDSITEPEATEPEATEPEATEPENKVDILSMKKADLVAFAEENGIEIPDGANVAVLKETIIAALEN